MKKLIVLSLVFVLFISLRGTAQCGSHKVIGTKKCCEAKKNATAEENNWKPFVEVTYQFGICDKGNHVGLIAGAQKQMTRHLSISGDVQFWRTNYENWCNDIHSIGKYTTVIPSVKFKLDPGKQDRGFFIGGGIGYAMVRDHGTEQPFTADPASGIKSNNGITTTGKWDFNTIAPSIQWGVSFKAFKLPVSLVNTSYFGNTTDGWDGIAVGTGLRVGLNKIRESAKTEHHKKHCCSKMMWRPCSH